MNKIKYLFSEKIKCIHNNISQNNLNELTNLFYAKDSKTSKDNRKSYISKKWLKSEDKAIYPRMFKSEYFKYKFSQLRLNGSRLFDTPADFLEMEIEPFCKIIKNYMQQQVEIKIEESDNYKYMYIFNINGVEYNHNIDYYKMEYLGSQLPSEIDIRIDPPKHKSLIEILPYKGKIKYQGNKIILTFQNSDDYISAIFNTDLVNNHSRYLVGIGIGIADINQKIPIAKKVILSKEKLEDLNELYLTLNESEILSAEENLYDYKYHDRDINANHFDKYAKKIDKLHNLFTNLSKQNIYNDFYYQLGFKEFSAINNIFHKLTQKQPYYIHNRKRVVDILLKSYQHEQYKKLYIVMPVYQDDNIFEHQSPQALQLQKELKQLSSRVDIEMIFIIDDCKKALSYEFKKFLEKVQKQIEIHFSLKKDIENEVNSIDFLFTDRDNFVITKFLRVNISVFNLYHDKATIDEHEAMYRRIYNRSISCNEFLKKGVTMCQSHNPILKTLLGKWYFHLYGAQKLWIGEINISKDGSVTALSENGEGGQGEIIHKTHQSIILLEDRKTNRLVTITFDHQPYKIAHAFTVQVISKQFKSDMEILTIGIVSRHHIEMEDFQEILGDVDEVRVLEKESIQKRLSEYLGGRGYL